MFCTVTTKYRTLRENLDYVCTFCCICSSTLRTIKYRTLRESLSVIRFGISRFYSARISLSIGLWENLILNSNELVESY
jgi:hypothetical protein